LKLDETDLTTWSQLIDSGAAHAVSRLSKMLGRDVRLSCLNMKTMSPDDAAIALGGAESPVVGIYLTIRVGDHGHILLVYPPQVAFGLVDSLLHRPPNSTRDFGPFEESVLGEVGNIVGTAFLNSLSDGTGTCLRPSPPLVMLDMAGAVLSVALSDILQDQDEICVMEAIFDTNDQQVSGTLLVMPSSAFVEAIKARIAVYRSGE
jgi:chemotaxis protein CheC